MRPGKIEHRLVLIFDNDNKGTRVFLCLFKTHHYQSTATNTTILYTKQFALRRTTCVLLNPYKTFTAQGNSINIQHCSVLCENVEF
ncbi:hypothetical protein LWI28_018559 [Acer negundo]|uniref:Uncharacterized protein n=1 Tax=Acer negundo TaxID=4023 RepID=A0AAD5INM8_ACENE|nr:hypothetical protein LWI28_018559 [Acer negundo]